MYRFPAWKSGFADECIPSSVLPTPDDDELTGQYQAADVNRPIPSILSRLKGGLEDPSVPRRPPDLLHGQYSRHVRDFPPAPYPMAANQRHQQFSPVDAQLAQSTSRYYTWRPTTGHFPTRTSVTQHAAEPQQHGDQRILASLRNALNNKAASREHRQAIPQKRRLDDVYPDEPQGDSGHYGMQARNERFQGNSRIMAAPRASVASPVVTRQAPRHLPPLESELLEAIQDHYCEEGGQLSAKVTSQLSSHHGELCQRLKQVASVDDKFLQRLNTCNALLDRPLSETITFRSDGKDSPVKLGVEIEKMRRKTDELEEFFERKGKEWDAAKAAEDAAWERILRALESQASPEDTDGGATDFMAKIDEEERMALEVMDTIKKKYKEESDRVTAELGNCMFDVAE